MSQTVILVVIIVATLLLFMWNRWRYDVVAMGSLLACAFAGLVPLRDTFSGFSHPAIITVAAVMVLSDVLNETGFVNAASKKLSKYGNSISVHLWILCLWSALISGFMNNIGALTIAMPLVLANARVHKWSPSLFLMPVAFSTVLGGVLTSIGTPPNIIVSEYRRTLIGEPFGIFDFTPVGIGVLIAGLILICTVGWRLLPARASGDKSDADKYKMDDYITEIRIPEKSSLIGTIIMELEYRFKDKVEILSLIRGNHRRRIYPQDELQANDVLVIEAGPKEIEEFLSKGNLELVTVANTPPKQATGEIIRYIEAVVTPNSRLENRSAQSVRLMSQYDIQLLGISRSGRAFAQKINKVILKAGDVLLLQGEENNLMSDVVGLGLLPLQERKIDIHGRKNAFLSWGIFTSAILLSAFNVLPIQICFLAAIMAMVLLDLLPLRRIYSSIDFSIIVLLGALFPVSKAIETTGLGADIAHFLVGISSQFPSYVLVAFLLIITMFLSDILNNAATALIMLPIAVSLAEQLGANVDPFLMIIAIGASCSFLTPIAHQNYAIVMGPGEYRFFDYMRLGLPLEIMMVVVGVPLILYFWPLYS